MSEKWNARTQKRIGQLSSDEASRCGLVVVGTKVWIGQWLPVDFVAKLFGEFGWRFRRLGKKLRCAWELGFTLTCGKLGLGWPHSWTDSLGQKLLWDMAGGRQLPSFVTRINQKKRSLKEKSIYTCQNTGKKIANYAESRYDTVRSVMGAAKAPRPPN